MLGKSAVRVLVSPLGAVRAAEPEHLELAGGAAQAALDVWVVRDPEKQKSTKVFVVLLIILITIANVMMGCEVSAACG